MTSLPQTHPRTVTAHESRRRSPLPPIAAGTQEAPGSARQALPAVDPSNAFGCVDWFLYPAELSGRAPAPRPR